MRDLLKKYFGFEQFRPLQEDIIQQVMAKEDCLVLMPTGGGKSLCFQLPALAQDGLTLVISPLIALMKDQVDQLKANGIPAAFLNSTLEFEEINVIKQQANRGELKLLYLAPERLTSRGFLDFLSGLHLSLIAIDEAHCISEWGHDFRPDYRNLTVLRDYFPNVPLMALTATATTKVRGDILKQLQLRQPKVFLSSFNRPNLTYSIQPKQKTFQRMVHILNQHKADSVIIYCFSRKATEQIAERLNQTGFKARAYHAGLESEVRHHIQEQFIRDQVNIIVATIAFGMGIDKPDVRLVIHHDLPKSVEGYYQETGRAGRDGLPAKCVLFFSYADKRKHEYFINQVSNPQERAKITNQLAQIVSYGELQHCRRRFLLSYFGEAYEQDNCASCDICRPEVIAVPTETTTYTVELFDQLRALRKQLADQLGVPPYIIFGNATLQEMATYFPQSPAALEYITGVGSKKLTQFGESFLKVIRAYAQTHQLTEQVKPTKPIQFNPNPTFIYAGSTYDQTKQLVLQKRSIKDIAALRKVSASTIMTHLEKLIEADPSLNLDYLKPAVHRFEKIAAAFDQLHSNLALNPARELLGDSFSYDEIRLARLFYKQHSLQ